MAPSKLERPSGDRVDTDAKDAVHLARLLRLDEITSVAVPPVAQEAARALVRAREDCRGDLMRAPHRLSKLLLRQGISCTTAARRGRASTTRGCAGNTSTPSGRDGVRRRVRGGPRCEGTPDRLDRAIEELAVGSEFTPVVSRRGGLRVVGTLTGFALAVEIGGWCRFTGNTISSFVGLCFLDRRKRLTVANIAIAHELTGSCWSLAVMDGTRRTGRVGHQPDPSGLRFFGPRINLQCARPAP